MTNVEDILIKNIKMVEKIINIKERILLIPENKGISKEIFKGNGERFKRSSAKGRLEHIKTPILLNMGAVLGDT